MLFKFFPDKKNAIVLLLATTFVLFSNECYSNDIANLNRQIQTTSSDSGKAKLLSKTGDYYFQKGSYDSSLIYYQKASQLYDSLGKSIPTGMMYLKLRKNYEKLHKNKDALIFAQKAKDQFEAVHNDSLIAKSLSLIGRARWNMGNFTEALDAYLASERLFKLLNDTASLGEVYNAIGSIHWFLGNYDIALDHYQRSLKIRETLQENDKIALTLNNIGLVFQDWGQIDEAIPYHKKALTLAKKIDYPFGKAYSQINLGIIWTKKGQYQKALRLFKKASKYFYDLKDPAGVAYIEKFLADVYDRLNQNEKAFEYYQSSMKNSQKVNNIFRTTVAQFNIGRIYKKMGDKDRAELFIRQSLVNSKLHKYKTLIKKSYELLAEINEERKNYKQALEYFKLATVYNDSIFNEQKIAAISDLQLRLKFEQQERENAVLRKNNKIQELTISRQKLQRNALIIILGLILITLILIIHKWYIARNINALLKKQNKEIKAINREKEKLINELKEALENVDQLENLLPICASCKKIRNDEGYWSSVEDYISKHSNIKFSHGICPDCMMKLYPEYYDDVQTKGEKTD